MALPFNPFEKPKKKYTKVKVFEKAKFETEEYKPLENVSNNVSTNVSINTPNNVSTNVSKELNVSTNVSTNVSINTPNNVSTNVSINVSTEMNILEGLQLKILHYLTLQIINDEETKEIKISDIIKQFNLHRKNAQSAIKELRKKSLIERTSFLAGRKGWVKFKISKQIQQECLYKCIYEYPQKCLQEYPSKKEDNLNNIFITEGLKKIGLKINHIKTQRDDLQDLLNHLEFSVQNNEIKSSNPLATVISIINNTEKIWVSSKLIQEQNLILAEQDNKIKQLLEMKNQKLLNEFEIYNLENPSFVQAIRNKNKNFDINEEVVLKIALEEFKLLQNA